MRDVLSHRGPDGAGLFIDGPVGLAHRRLAIVDVSSAGEQPMTNEDGSVWIAFNGEIYNHASLRPGLEAQGHRYRSRCDTETIIHLYEEDGDACVEKLHGMFAFAIWDKTAAGAAARARSAGHQAALLRQHRQRARVRVGNQIALRVGLRSADLQRRGAAGVSLDALRVGRRHVLPRRAEAAAGSCAHLVGGEGDSHAPLLAAARPVERASDMPFEAQAKDLRARLEASVESHLMSDVPLGVFLSGGLDSSALAAMMSSRRCAIPIQIVFGRVRRGRGERASVRANRGQGDRRDAPRCHGHAVRLLRSAAASRVARRRADCVSVERAALLRRASWRATTSKSC